MWQQTFVTHKIFFFQDFEAGYWDEMCKVENFKADKKREGGQKAEFERGY